MKHLIAVLFSLFCLFTTGLAALPNNPSITSLAKQLTDEWTTYQCDENPLFDLEKLKRAIDFAAKKHEGQTRKDQAATPYIIHPLQVCNNLWEIGKVRNANILTAAILHDTLEDTSATEKEITDLFGPRVCQTVKEVTNDPHLDSQAAKQQQIDHVPFMSQDARLVKLADRLANITDLAEPPPSWSNEAVECYYGWGEKLLRALKGTNASMESALAGKIATHCEAVPR